jgi:hypothetical protein
MHKCRECEEEINQATEVCPHCGADLTVPLVDEPASKPSLGKILLRWGILLGILLGAMWSFVWFVVSPRTGRVALQAETQAVQALRELQSSLFSYSQAQGGRYPASLEALGVDARRAAQMAQSEGYVLQYSAGPEGADGTSRSYVLHARAGNYGFRNFYTDSSGVIRFTAENREATPSDPALQ